MNPENRAAALSPARLFRVHQGHYRIAASLPSCAIIAFVIIFELLSINPYRYFTSPKHLPVMPWPYPALPLAKRFWHFYRFIMLSLTTPVAISFITLLYPSSFC